MEKERLPWWRWALEFALGGIRSGFGLFRRNGKVEASSQPTLEAVVAEPAIEGAELGTESSLEPDSSFEQKSSPESEVVEVESNAEKSTEPESSFEPENKEIELEANAEQPAAVENSSEPESRVEPENIGSDVESVAIASAADKSTEPEIASIMPTELPEDNPAELAPAETAEEDSAVTNLSPKSDDTVTGPAHEAAPASAPEEAFASAPANPADPAPEPIAVPEADPAQDAAPALPFDPPMAPEPPVAEPTTAEKVAAALKARGVDAEQSPFSVIVNQVYDGPLDLLLDLIRKQDIDIYDIPIAKITAQFLAYVDRLRASDMDVAGDFIYTAALLIHIKSKMLLPRAPVGPEESTEDPRRELVDRLLEHERFKNAAQMLHEKQMLEAATWTNPGVREFREDAGAEPEIAADTTDLVRIFRDILDRARNRPILDVEEDSVTVGQMIQFLTRRLTMEDKPVALRRLLSHTHSERALIAMFLGLLELVRLQAILLRQDRQFSEIFIKKNTGFDAVANEGLASAHDNWR